jgi:hypothetical protein
MVGSCSFRRPVAWTARTKAESDHASRVVRSISGDTEPPLAGSYGISFAAFVRHRSTRARLLVLPNHDEIGLPCRPSQAERKFQRELLRLRQELPVRHGQQRFKVDDEPRLRLNSSRLRGRDYHA